MSMFNAYREELPTIRPDPIRALIAAIMQRALDDLRRGPLERGSVMAWVNTTGNQRPGSFQWCCEALNLNPDAVRRMYRDQVTSMVAGATA